MKLFSSTCLLASFLVLTGCTGARMPGSCYVRRVDTIEAWLEDGTSKHSLLPTFPRKIDVSAGAIEFDLYSLEFGGVPQRAVISFELQRRDRNALRISDPVLVRTSPKVAEHDVQRLRTLASEQPPVEIKRNTWTQFFPTKDGSRPSRVWELWWGNKQPE